MDTPAFDPASAITHLGVFFFSGFLILSFAWSIAARLLSWVFARLRPWLERLFDTSKAAIGRTMRRRRGFRLILADLAGDTEGGQTALVAEALSSIPVLKVARISAPAGWKFAGRIEMERQAQELLRARKADVLVFGRVERAAGCLSINFLGRDFGMDRYELGTVELPTGFDAGLAPFLVNMALTRVTLAGQDDVPLLLDWLLPQTLQLKALCEAMPGSLSNPQRAGLLHAVGQSAALVARLTDDINGHHLALASYRHALDGLDPEAVPLQRAGTLNALAIALRHLGQDENDPALLEEAVATFGRALEERRRDLVPFDWAETKLECGTALALMAELEGPARLEEAAASVREALEEYRPERAPVRWATAQIALAHILQRLGRNTPTAEPIEEAVRIARKVLADLPPERAPFAWAQANTTLGHALEHLAERKGDPLLLVEAVEVYGQALKKWPRSRLPLRWAATHANVGNVLCRLAEWKDDPETLHLAIACYREALRVQRRGTHPLSWAATQNSLGLALRLLGEKKRSRRHLKAAISAYRRAQEEWTRDRVPLDWAMAEMNLGVALCVLGQQRRSTRLVREGIAAFYRSLEERPREEMPVEWAESQGSIAKGLRAIGEIEKSPQKLTDAVAAYRAVLEIHDPDKSPYDWAQEQWRLATCLLSLARMKHGIAEFSEAQKAFETAAKAYRLAGAYRHEAACDRMLEEIRVELERLEARAAAGGSLPGRLLPEIRHLVRRALRLGRKVVVG